MSETRTTVADRVRAARKRANLSQAGLAEAADISTETVSRVERGAYDPSLATAIDLADALGVSLDYLAGRRKTSGPKRDQSPLVARLASRASDLPTAAQRALLRIAEMIEAA